MLTVQEFRENAIRCMVIAETAETETTKAGLLKIAMKWMELAAEREKAMHSQQRPEGHSVTPIR